METKNKNALSVGLCLSLVVVLLFNVYSTVSQYANAVLQWTVLQQNAVSVHPNFSIIDSNGNIDVSAGVGANIYQFSGTSPYSLLHTGSFSASLGCTSMGKGMFLDSVHSRLWAWCGTNLLELDSNTLGLLNTTSATQCCGSIYMSGNILFTLRGGTGIIYAYFINGNNIIKCGTNAGQCGSIATFSTAPNACTQFNTMVPDFTHSITYLDCLNPTVSISTINLNSLVAINTWNKANGNIAGGFASTIQNVLAYDNVNNGIWSSEGASTLQFYNSTGSAIRTITIAGANGGLTNPQIINNQIFFEDLTHAFEQQYFTNGTAIANAYFGTTVVTPVTSASSFSVSSNSIAVVGAEANAGSSTIFLGGIATGNIGNGGSGGGGCNNTNPNCGCPTTTTNCGDVNCNLPQNQGLLLCTTGGGAVQNNGFFVTTAVNNLLIGSGLINSTNTNVKTNGVGYILVMVALGVLTAMFWLASGGDLGRIPTFVWFIATLGILGLAVGVGFIDVTFFIIGAIAVIALATARILSTLELGGFR